MDINVDKLSNELANLGYGLRRLNGKPEQQADEVFHAIAGFVDRKISAKTAESDALASELADLKAALAELVGRVEAIEQRAVAKWAFDFVRDSNGVLTQVIATPQ